jgi:hypothetical protein
MKGNVVRAVGGSVGRLGQWPAFAPRTAYKNQRGYLSGWSDLIAAMQSAGVGQVFLLRLILGQKLFLTSA